MCFGFASLFASMWLRYRSGMLPEAYYAHFPLSQKTIIAVDLSRLFPYFSPAHAGRPQTLVPTRYRAMIDEEEKNF